MGRRKKEEDIPVNEIQQVHERPEKRRKQDATQTEGGILSFFSLAHTRTLSLSFPCRLQIPSLPFLKLLFK